MLPQKNRLKKEKDFDEVFEKGKGFNSSLLFLKAKRNNLKVKRFGFVVSQKVSKKAIVRNRVKRFLREAIKERLKEIKSGVDIVLVTKPGIEKEDSLKIKKTVFILLEKTKLLNDQKNNIKNN